MSLDELDRHCKPCVNLVDSVIRPFSVLQTAGQHGGTDPDQEPPIHHTAFRLLVCLFSIAGFGIKGVRLIKRPPMLMSARLLMSF